MHACTCVHTDVVKATSSVVPYILFTLFYFVLLETRSHISLGFTK